MNQINYLAQQENLYTISRKLPPLKERSLEIIVSFQPEYRLRTIPHRYLSTLNETKFFDASTPRQVLWEAHGDYAFVASPRGLGLDTHRTWEALFLGSIVIVRSSSIDELFEDLPVVIGGPRGAPYPSSLPIT